MLTSPTHDSDAAQQKRERREAAKVFFSEAAASAAKRPLTRTVEAVRPTLFGVLQTLQSCVTGFRTLGAVSRAPPLALHNLLGPRSTRTVPGA